MKNKGFLKDFILVFMSNGLGLLLSVAMNLLLPIFFGKDVSSYGYIQLYLLYSGYYCVFNLGMCNGIYLKEGGNDFNSLNKSLYSGQFIILTVWQVVLGLIFIGGIIFFCDDYDKKIVYLTTIISVVFMSVREMFSVFFQATSKMKEYSVITILSKMMHVIVIAIAFVLAMKDYKLLLYGFAIGEIIVTAYSVFAGRKLTFNKPCGFKIAIKEVLSNIASGYTILVSGYTAMLITGFARICVENHWGIESFSKLSFTISLANLFVVFANAASVVLYPRLRKVDECEREQSYKKINELIVLMLFFGIGFCYPAKLILQAILPEYEESLVYISILLPICVYIGKSTMATQTFMKALRLEKQLMISNILSFVVSALLVVISVYVVNDITFTVFSILIGQMLRTVFCEIFLAKTMKISVLKNTVVECVLTAGFIVTHWVIGGWIGSIIYLAAVAAYIIFSLVTTKINKGKIKNGK